VEDWSGAFELELAVRDYECDLQGIVNNAVYQNYLEHARHEYLHTLGVDFAALHAAGTEPVVTRIEIDYRAPVQPRPVRGQAPRPALRPAALRVRSADPAKRGREGGGGRRGDGRLRPRRTAGSTARPARRGARGLDRVPHAGPAHPTQSSRDFRYSVSG